MALSFPHPQPPSLRARPARQVVVERVAYDVNHPELTTLRFLGFQEDTPPGSPLSTGQAFIKLMANQSQLGTRFATPIGMVQAEKPTPAFFAAARQLQHAHWRQLKDILGSSSRVKRHFKSLKPLARQLQFTGVMIIDGKHVLPHRWPLPNGQPLKISLCGKRYGRLVVLGNLSIGRCQCRCDCGNQAIVKRKHLVAGRTKSCGCLQAECTKRRHDRKRKQSWLRSGQLSL